MIGSHNTLSYLPPENLWGKITRLWNKCQDKNIREQFNAGVRYFDVRIKIIDGKWYIVHNNVIYKYIYGHTLANLFNVSCKKDKCYIRIILDIRKKPKDVIYYRTEFSDFVDNFSSWLNDNIIVDSAITYWDWKEYRIPDINIREYHASVKAKWYQYILGCKWFAKHYNNYAKQRYYSYSEDNEHVLLLDYV